MRSSWPAGVAVAVTLAAGFIRLDSLPPYLIFDLTDIAWWSARSLHGAPLPEVSARTAGGPVADLPAPDQAAAYPARTLAIAAGVSIFGHSPRAVLVPAILCGALAIGIITAWAAVRAGPWAGLAAGLLVATSHLYLFNMRMGYSNWTLEIGLLTAALWAVTADRWAIAGLCLGLMIPALRYAVFLPATLVLFALMTMGRIRWDIRGGLHGLAAGTAGGLLLVLLAWIPLRPMSVTESALQFQQSHHTWAGRISVVHSVPDYLRSVAHHLSSLLTDLTPAATGFFQRVWMAGPNGAEAIPHGGPLLPPLLTALIVVGVARGALRRDTTDRLIWAWIAGSVATLSWFTYEPRRYGILLPVAALLAADGLAWIGGMARSISAFVRAALAAAVLLTCAWGIRDYVVRFPEIDVQSGALYAGVRDAAAVILAEPTGGIVLAGGVNPSEFHMTTGYRFVGRTATWRSWRARRRGADLRTLPFRSGEGTVWALVNPVRYPGEAKEFLEAWSGRAVPVDLGDVPTRLYRLGAVQARTATGRPGAISRASGNSARSARASRPPMTSLTTK